MILKIRKWLIKKLIGKDISVLSHVVIDFQDKSIYRTDIIKSHRDQYTKNELEKFSEKMIQIKAKFITHKGEFDGNR